GQGAYYDPVMIEMGKRRKHKGYTTDIITDITLDLLKNKRDKDKPFFVMYHHKAPHRNWQPGPKHKTLYDDRDIPVPETFDDDKTGYADRGTAARAQKMSMKDLREPGQRRPGDLGDLKVPVPKGLTPEQERMWRYQRYIKDYLRCIASVDDNVGRVLDYLDETGLADNTVVFYTSDQGFFLGDHNWFDKRFMYEESLRMPLLVRWPGHIKPGSINTNMVLNLDFAETFLAIAGQPIPKDMQGCSLLPLLEGHAPADWRRSMYYRYYEMPGPHSVHKQYGVRTERYKLIYFPDLDEWEMFDLQTDPNELKSVYDDSAYAKIRDELKAELKRLKEYYGDDDSVTGPAWPPKKMKKAKR
ncbi:MAG: DUF4976 domain-containing protein, partial [Pirellulales bacterium]|nr:DUF4976 domain-containing protein [Pirellulales bacterium]